MQDGASACLSCLSGYYHADGASACEACGLGNYSLESASTCEECNAGYYGDKRGLSSCEACPVGFVASVSGLKACRVRPLGTRVGPISQCEAGSFSEGGNSTSCTECAVGTFSNVSGMSECRRCSDVRSPSGANPELWVTMELILLKNEYKWVPATGADSADRCGCDEGAWQSRDSQCHLCVEGSVCAGMGKATVLPGYFAPENNPGDVWLCHGSDGACCPGRRLNTSIACGVPSGRK